MFDKILMPLDGSPRAELILEQIEKVLRRKDSEIVLLRVVDLPEPSLLETAKRSVYETARGVERAEALRYVLDLADRLGDRGIRARGLVAEGPAAVAILEKAKQEGATLIAMSTHGRTGLSRWTAGSVAEKVVRAAAVPVLLVRSFHPTPLGDRQSAPKGELPFRKILVPTDGSPASSAAFDAACELAHLFGAKVVLLHVELPVVLPGGGEMTVQPILPPPPSEEDPITAGPAERFRRAGIAVERRTVAGNPSSEILDVAHAEGLDLIVMSTHGRSGFSRWLLGSVAERVLRHAEVPLLLVRAPKAAENPESRTGRQAASKSLRMRTRLPGGR